MRKFVFADEAGDFEFARKPNVSKYFIVCTVTMNSCDIGLSLLELRRQLIWEKYPIKDFFHACEDSQAVRDRVFELIHGTDIVIEATILEKSKAQPQTRPNNARFYQYGWFYHLYGIHHRLRGSMNSFLGEPEDTAPCELIFTTASVGTRRQQAAFTASVNDVVQQFMRNTTWVTHFCPSMADPCLQIADYCTWAIQRKWERGDTRSYDLIQNKIAHEYESWAHGKTHYY
jgi:hypothetical protein